MDHKCKCFNSVKGHNLDGHSYQVKKALTQSKYQLMPAVFTTPALFKKKKK